MNYLSITCIFLMMTSTGNNKSLTVKSSAFGQNDFIPAMFTCDGSNVNPPITVENIPGNAKTLALIMDDPDAPKGTFDHWIIWNINPSALILQNSAPGTQGKNGKNESSYTGPCPPGGIHHYHFKVYALDTELSIPEGSDKKSLEKAMEGHILAKGELIGRYKRP